MLWSTAVADLLLLMQTFHTPDSIIESAEGHRISDTGLSQCQVCSIGQFDPIVALVVSARRRISTAFRSNFLYPSEG